MLTKEAWNAFLKTLEEPPPNTVFVLATTEAHKVMATIADRCQRFDFQRPSLEQISEVLNRVAAAEGIEVDDGAVAMIARSASGSFRDALGTLDQLVAFGGEPGRPRRRCWRCSAPPTPSCSSTRSTRSSPRTRRRSCSGSRRWPAPAATRSQFARDLLAHLRHLLVTQTIGEVPDHLRRHRHRRRPPRRPGRRGRRRDPGPHDRRAGGGADRGPRGRRRPHGGRDRPAQSGAARSGSLDRGAAAPGRAAGETADGGAARAAGSCRGGGASPRCDRRAALAADPASAPSPSRSRTPPKTILAARPAAARASERRAAR